MTIIAKNIAIVNFTWFREKVAVFGKRMLAI